MEAFKSPRSPKAGGKNTDQDEDQDDQFDDVPLHHKRPFGSGLQRKPIAFVPASDGDLHVSEQITKPSPSQNIGDLYLSMVLPKERSRSEPPQLEKTAEVCSVCRAPLARNSGNGVEEDSQVVVVYPKNAHESSLAHQVCLAHSHPPSALDRSRMGLKNLESYGWDPDLRSGLGASEQGIKFPLKSKPKLDTLGLGQVVPKNAPKPKEKKQLLDAGKIKKMAKEDKRKTDILRRHLYSNQDLEKYLGSGYGG